MFAQAIVCYLSPNCERERKEDEKISSSPLRVLKDLIVKRGIEISNDMWRGVFKTKRRFHYVCITLIVLFE